MGLREQAEQRARAQVVEERLRFARELQDIVAHNRSLITMRASVAGYIGDGHPEEAVKVLAAIEETGRGALHDLRRPHGMLRDSEGIPQDPELVPNPGLGDPDELVTRTAETGLRVDLRISGARREPPAPLEWAVHRVAQEALTIVTIRSVTTDIMTVGRRRGGRAATWGR